MCVIKVFLSTIQMAAFLLNNTRGRPIDHVKSLASQRKEWQRSQGRRKQVQNKTGRSLRQAVCGFFAVGHFAVEQFAVKKNVSFG